MSIYNQFLNNMDSNCWNIEMWMEENNLFYDHFGQLSDEEWEQILIKSLKEENINNVFFPRFPPSDYQRKMHSSDDTKTIHDSMAFYKFIKKNTNLNNENIYKSNKTLLDFGCGWGRMSRPFLRDFKLKNIHAYEPTPEFCTAARILNPYINIFNGDFLPPCIFQPNSYDLIISYSIFTHLTESYLHAWLHELARITKPNGTIVLTFHGQRFLKYFLSQHPNFDEFLEKFAKDGFLWMGSHTTFYGLMFMSLHYIVTTVEKIAPNLKIHTVNKTGEYEQDILVLRKI